MEPCPICGDKKWVSNPLGDCIEFEKCQCVQTNNKQEGESNGGAKETDNGAKGAK